LALLLNTAVSVKLQGGIAQKQDKGLSWDFPVILAEFSPDSVGRMEAKLIYIKLLWRFTLCS